MAHKRQAPRTTVSEDKWHEGAMESARKKQKCKERETQHQQVTSAVTAKKKGGRMKQDPKRYFWQDDVQGEKVCKIERKMKKEKMKENKKVVERHAILQDEILYCNEKWSPISKDIKIIDRVWEDVMEEDMKLEKEEMELQQKMKENENVEQKGVNTLECMEKMGPKPVHLKKMTPTYSPTYTPLYDPNASWQASTGVKLAMDCPVTPGYDAPACGSAPRDQTPQNYLSPVYAELQRAFHQAMTPERILPDGDPAEWIDHWDVVVARKYYSYRDTHSRCAAKYSVGGRSPAAAKNSRYKDGDDSVVAEDAVKRSERIWNNRERKAIDFRIRCFLAMGKILDRILIESK